MKITFTGQFNSQRSKTISKEEIVEIIKQPAQSYDTQMGNSFISIISKNVKKYEANVLILGKKIEDDFQIDLVYLLKNSLFPIQSLKPMDLLAVFVKKYGLEIRIGKTTDKLIYHQTFWRDKSNIIDIVKIINPFKNSFQQHLTIKFEEHGSKIKIDCHLAFCIDTKKYMSELT